MEPDYISGGIYYTSNTWSLGHFGLVPLVPYPHREGEEGTNLPLVR